MNKLILHIDDLWLSKSTNSAIFKLNDKWLIFSWSLMANTQWFQDFVEWYKSTDKKMDIWAHINLTSEWDNSKTRPISDLSIVESLVDENWLFFSRLEDTNTFDRQHVEVEIRAQIEFILDHWVHLSHIDSHMWVLLHKKYIDIYLRIARQYWLNAFCSYPKDYFKEWFWFYGAEDYIKQYEWNWWTVLWDFDSDSLCNINNYENLEVYEKSLIKRLERLSKNTSITISHVLDPSSGEDDSYIKDKHMRYVEYEFLLSWKFEKLIKNLWFNLVKVNQL